MLGPIIRKVLEDPSVEQSHYDGSEGSQHMFSLRNKKLSLNYLQFTFLSGALSPSNQ